MKLLMEQWKKFLAESEDDELSRWKRDLVDDETGEDDIIRFEDLTDEELDDLHDQLVADNLAMMATPAPSMAMAKRKTKKDMQADADELAKFDARVKALKKSNILDRNEMDPREKYYQTTGKKW